MPAFRDVIYTEQNRAIFDYWSSRRSGKAAPMRGEIDPTDIPKLLRHIYMWQLGSDGMTLTGRLFGTAYTDFAGADFRGRTFEQAHQQSNPLLFDRLRAGHLRCLRDCDPYVVVRTNHAFNRRYRAYEGMILPVADETGRPYILLGGLVPLFGRPTEVPSELDIGRYASELTVENDAVIGGCKQQR